MRVGVFHPGSQNSWQRALAFQERDALGWYATSIYYDPGRWPYRVERYLPAALAEKLRREFKRRHFTALDGRNVRQLGLWEWYEIGARRLRRHRFAEWLNEKGNARFGQAVIDLIKREPLDVVWGYNTSSAEVFRWAKKQGLICVLDQSVGHAASMNRVLLAERQRHPHFFLPSYNPFSEKWIEQQNEEAALADVIVVGSPFCAQTMIDNGCPEEKIRIVPYGFDETLFPAVPPQREPPEGRPMRFLFVGAVHARKGAAYLLQAFQDIPQSDATLTLIGRLAIPEATFARYADRVRHISQIPRWEVVKHMRAADCFVFPSLFEGSAITLYEAVGAGLGIIQSAASGIGAEDGRNGLCLDTVSVDALTEAIMAVVSDRSRLAKWQAASWNMRGERTWAKYRHRVAQLFQT